MSAALDSGAGTPSVGGAGTGEAAENVQVVIRVRPVNKAEKERGERTIVECSTDRNEVTATPPNKTAIPAAAATRRFTFDRVYDAKATQEQLFEQSVAPVVDEVLAGYSCTVFAYGQTGTGKTFTMEGAKKDDGSLDTDSASAGIIARAVRRAFTALSSTSVDSSAKISFLEIYNERLDDLLASEPSTFMSVAPVAKSGKERNLFGEGVSMPSLGLGATMGGGGGGMGGGGAGLSSTALEARDRLKIVEDKAKGIRVQNLEEVAVKSADEVFALVTRGIAKRATAETACNAQSSRSHCVFTLTIHMREVVGGEDVIRVGKLNLVDLAGSECVGRSGAKDARAREAGNINQSLLTLGRVITALVDHLPHIPYRDSKLTRLLQDSLGGRTKTCIIATLSPAAGSFEESISTLEYANRAKNIKNRPEANARMEKRALITSYTGEIEVLRAKLAAQISKDGHYIPEEEYEAMMANIARLEYDVEDLRSAKATHEEEIDKLRAALAGLKEELTAMTELQATTAKQLEETAGALATTEAAYSAEQTAHEESRVVARAHASTEAMLTQQASGVLGTLQGTVADVAGLHGKVARTMAVVDHNKRAGASFADGVAERLGGLFTATTAFAADNAGHLTAARGAMGQLQADHARQAGAIAGILARLQEKTGAHIKAISDRTEALAGESNAAADAIGKEAARGRTALVTVSAAHLQSIMEDISKAATALDALKASADAWATTSKKALQEASSRVTTFAASHAAALTDVQTGVDANAAAVDALLGAQAEALARMERERTAHLQAASQDLLATIAASMQGFVAAQSAAVAASVGDLTAGITVARKDVEASRTATGAKVAAASDDSSKFAKSLDSHLHATRGAVQSAHEGALAGVQGVHSALGVVETSADAMHKEVSTYAGAGEKALLEEAKASKATIEKSTSVLKTRSLQASRALTSDVEAAVAAVTECDATTATTAQDADGAVERAEAASAAFTGSVRSWVASESTAVTDFFGSTLKEPVVTGRTPAKKDYAAPVTFVATSPADVIIGRYRQARDMLGAGQAEAAAGPAVMAERDRMAFGKPMPPQASIAVDASVAAGSPADARPRRDRSGSLSEHAAASLAALISQSAASPVADVTAAAPAAKRTASRTISAPVVEVVATPVIAVVLPAAAVESPVASSAASDRLSYGSTQSTDSTGSAASVYSAAVTVADVATPASTAAVDVPAAAALPDSPASTVTDAFVPTEAVPTPRASSADLMAEVDATEAPAVASTAAMPAPVAAAGVAAPTAATRQRRLVVKPASGAGTASVRGSSVSGSSGAGVPSLSSSQRMSRTNSQASLASTVSSSSLTSLGSGIADAENVDAPVATAAAPAKSVATLGVGPGGRSTVVRSRDAATVSSGAAAATRRAVVRTATAAPRTTANLSDASNY